MVLPREEGVSGSPGACPGERPAPPHSRDRGKEPLVSGHCGAAGDMYAFPGAGTGGPHRGSWNPPTPAPPPQDEKDQLNEYRGHLSGLAKRAKAIVQLTPRNPAQPTRGRVPLLAVCDYKQGEVRAWPGGRGLGGGWAWPHADGSGCCRRRCTRAMSARCWAPHSRSTGKCSAAPAARLPCPPCASSCPRQTRRPWRLWPGAWSWAGRPAGW